MSCEDRIRLVKMLVGLGGVDGIGPSKELEELACGDPTRLTPGQLRCLAGIARCAARLMESEADLAEAAA